MRDPTGPRGWYSRGYLPHYDSPETIQHIVFRTADSLPGFAQLDALTDFHERQKAIGQELDRGMGSRPLANPAAAKIVEDALLHFDGSRYRLLAWCVIPNHVHVLTEQIEGFHLPDIVHSWKSFTALAINRLQETSGLFWAREYYDRYMRNEEQTQAAIFYIEDNPVKAGLVSCAQEWLFTSARHRDPRGTEA
ncbi:putative DNA methylase [Rhizobiales bacterium GAS191]|nr:putative DNA methylase [Rhizobiales bacterium GAS113]SEC64356.1 putative DNA methylase [Rhizobiales bacterium GAS188]SEC64754.1 putative DNA methylase [Rhizobiales bacterium GAS191]